MTSKVALTIDDALFRKIDGELGLLPLLHRQPALKDGMRRLGKVVEKRLHDTLPKPGYPGDKKGLTPLRDALGTKVIEYDSGKLVAVTGYEWYGGQHGRNVEEGHRIAQGGTLVNPKKRLAPKSKVTGERGQGTVAGFVEGRHYLAHAVEATKTEQADAMVAAIDKALSATKRG